MRLIDADKLIRRIEKSYLTKGEKRLFIIKVRHMDTVDSSDAKYLEERDADAYESGYLQGHIEGYQKAEKDYATPLGEWIKDYTDTCFSFLGYHCSLCNAEALDKNDYSYASNFCPNCGARMRGADK